MWGHPTCHQYFKRLSSRALFSLSRCRNSRRIAPSTAPSTSTPGGRSREISTRAFNRSCGVFRAFRPPNHPAISAPTMVPTPVATGVQFVTCTVGEDAREGWQRAGVAGGCPPAWLGFQPVGVEGCLRVCCRQNLGGSGAAIPATSHLGFGTSRGLHSATRCTALAALTLVRDTGIEPVTSSVSGKRSPAELIAPGTNLWRWRRESNPCARLCRPLPHHSATPPRGLMPSHLRADDGIRTRDPHLGKVMRYQLRYIRVPPARSSPVAKRNDSPRTSAGTNPLLAGGSGAIASRPVPGVPGGARAAATPR